MRAAATVQQHVDRNRRPAAARPRFAEPEVEEELRVRLDDVPIPVIPLEIDALKPTLGSLVLGLIERLRPTR